MTKPTFTTVFGANATQDADSITISKADLTSTGLTALANNTSEELIAALIKQWKTTLTEANQDTNPEQQITVILSYQTLVTRNNIRYRQYSITVSLDVPDSESDFDPDAF